MSAIKQFTVPATLVAGLLSLPGCPAPTAAPAVEQSSEQTQPAPQTGPAAPSLQPVLGAQTARTELRWSTVAGAVSYTLYAGPTSPPPRVFSISGTSFTLSDLSDCTTYYWYVEAVDAAGGRTASDTLSFRTPCLGDYPAAPRYPAPAHATVGVDARVTLTWSSDDAAEVYDVYLGETNVPELVGQTIDAKLELGRALRIGGRYYWRVVARNATGSTTSPTWSFEVKGDPRGPDAPSPLAPADAATDVRPRVRLDWADAQGAVAYGVELGDSPDALTRVAQVSESTCVLTDLPLGARKYWRTIAYGADALTTGPVQSFTVVAAPAAPLEPSQPAPEDGAVWAPRATVLSWVDDPSATSYRVYLSPSADPPLIATVTSPVFLPAEPLLPGRHYAWQVVAVNEHGETAGPVWRLVTAGWPDPGTGGGGGDGGDGAGGDDDGGPGGGTGGGGSAGGGGGVAPTGPPEPTDDRRAGAFLMAARTGECGGTLYRLASGTDPAVSANGLVVAFASRASDLVSGDSNGASDVFVYDFTTSQFTRVSVSTSGAQGRGNSRNPGVSADGRYVAFETAASFDGVSSAVFVHDRATGTTSPLPGRLTHDGRFTWRADAGTLHPITGGSSSRLVQIEGERADDIAVSVNAQASVVWPASANLYYRAGATVEHLEFRAVTGDISATGARAVWAGIFNGGFNAAMWDGQQRHNFTPIGDPFVNYVFDIRISGDGRYAALAATSTGVSSSVTGDSLFVRRALFDAGSADLISMPVDGGLPNGRSMRPRISHDGRTVVFTSSATNLFPEGNQPGVFVVRCD